MALTRRQKQIYDFLANFIRENGYSPSFEEIGSALGLRSLATVHKHVSNLEAKGLVKRDYNRSRSIDVLPMRPRRAPAVAPPPADAKEIANFSLPLLGRIAAGGPIEQFVNPETISLNDFSRSKDVFVLEVNGESMKDDHILTGDYVLVERAQQANDGEIVVALVEGAESTLKRIYREGAKVRLQPANAAMKPIIVPAHSVQIQGRVVGVLRKY